MLIEDGVGKGFKVKVDDENRLHSESVCLDYELHANEAHGEAYTMDIDGISTDAANYWLAIIKNTDDVDMHITSVTLWLPVFKDTAIIEAYIGGTFTYATNGTAVVPANCNAGSGKTAIGEFYVNDGSGNITTVVAGSVCGRFIFTSIPTRWVKGCHWVLPKNQCFMLWSNKDGESFKGYISFYYHNVQ